MEEGVDLDTTEFMFRHYPCAGIRRPSDHRYESIEDWNMLVADMDGGGEKDLCVNFDFEGVDVEEPCEIARESVLTNTENGIDDIPVSWYKTNLEDDGSVEATVINAMDEKRLKSLCVIMPSALFGTHKFQLCVKWKDADEPHRTRLQNIYPAEEGMAGVIEALQENVAAPLPKDSDASTWPFGTLTFPLGGNSCRRGELTDQKIHTLRTIIRTMCLIQYKDCQQRLRNLYLVFLHADDFLYFGVVDLTYSPFFYVGHTPIRAEATFVLSTDLALVARQRVEEDVEDPKWYCPAQSVLFPDWRTVVQE
jgi:hypothetical protein